MTTPNNIIDEKDALRVVAQMTIGEIVRGIAALSKSAPVAESLASDGTREWPRVFVHGSVTRVFLSSTHHRVFLDGSPDKAGFEMMWFEKVRREHTELTGETKLAKLKELGCDERGVYVGKGETREWPKLVGQRNWEPSFACWVFQSSDKCHWWVDGQVGECIYSLDSLLEDKRMVVLDTPEARAFIAKRYDEQGNLRAEYRKGKTPKVRVFTLKNHPENAWVVRGERDWDALENGQHALTATECTWDNHQSMVCDELPPAEVPAWLARHGYAIDGTRKQEKAAPEAQCTPVVEPCGARLSFSQFSCQLPEGHIGNHECVITSGKDSWTAMWHPTSESATPIDPDAGKKYGEAVQDLVRFAQDTHVACMKWGKFESGSIEETNLVSEILSAAHTASLAANRVKRLDAAQGGVR